MKLNKKYFAFILILEAILITKMPSYISPAKIEGIYQSSYYDVNFREECKSTVVLISNPPFTLEGMKKLWISKKENIINKWEPLTKDCDRLHFVKNNFEQPHDSAEIKYWVGDHQFCFRGILDGKCISSDDVLLVGSLIEALGKNHFTDKYKDKVVYVSHAE